MVMIPNMTVDLRRKGIKNYKKLVPKIRRNLMITLKVFGNAAVRAMRKKMKTGGYADNSPPWRAAKGGGKVLFNTGHLSTKIKSRLIPGAGSVFAIIEIGLFSGEPHPRQTTGDIQDIAIFLTGKRSWIPSPKSKKAFWSQVPKGWVPQNKKTWTSPKRDFIQDTARDPALIALLHKHIDYAIKRAIKGK